MGVEHEDLLLAADLIDAMERLSNGDIEGSSDAQARALDRNEARTAAALTSFAAQFAEQLAAALGCTPADLYMSARRMWARAYSPDGER